MGFQREVAIKAMMASSEDDDFLKKVIPQIARPEVPGALPAMTRLMVPAAKILKPMDLVINWGIGDFDPNYRCSAYYDPSSPWYNVFYGFYALLSYRKDGLAWGYSADGKADFKQFLKHVAEVDYNYFTASQFGCPPQDMDFLADVAGTPKTGDGWDIADIEATVTSGLHDPTKYNADIGNNIAFGIPDPSFLVGRCSFEPVKMRGRFYMRRLVKLPKGMHPITLVWGSACPDTLAGNKLLKAIIKALGKTYVKLGA